MKGYEVSEQEKQAYRDELKQAIADGIVKDPALYWADRMAEHVAHLYQAKATSISDLVIWLRFFQEQYDAEIFGRIP
jgi:hypothetical protein